MTRRFLAAFAAAAVLVGAVIPTALAANPNHPAQRIDITKRIDSSLLPRLLDKNRKVTVMLQMSGDPVAVQQSTATHTLSTSERTTARAGIKKHQDAIVPQIQTAGGRIIGQLQDAYNGIQVSVPAGKVMTLAALPGVTAVHAVATYTPSNSVGVPYVGAQQAWQDTGFTGKGVIIADIDTGLDYYHADFGGSGKVADYNYGFAHDTTAPAFNADGTTVAFPSAKVPKGYDFVGDNYNADPTAADYQPIPHPDPNPLDCPFTSGDVGHGTHTAGTAAGQGVLADGSTFTGPYDSTTYTAHTFKVGPGSAPEATLYSYRVFGCNGSSDIVDLAINKAVMDGANVINMSLGSPFGGQDDPTTVAANNAAKAGVIVVASAGNEGPSGYMVGSPSTGARVLSVAALDSEFASYPSGVVGLASGAITGVDANAGPLPVTGRLKVLSNGAGGISLGCADADYASVAPGDIVVTERGVCARIDRATKGSAAGAAAVIMVNNAAGLPPFEGDIAGVTIPFIGVPGGTDAAFLAADGATVTIANGGAIPNATYQTVANFSSGGPAAPDSAPKPDVTAPGVSVLSASSGTGTDGQRLSGTSMAAPITTGVAALVRQAHPNWSVNQVKAAIMNTADATGAKIVGYDPRIAGSGVVSAKAAVTTVALATTADKRDSLAFGYDQLTGGWSEIRTFTIRNTSNQAIRYKIAAAFNGDAQGVVANVWPANVKVEGRSSVTIAVRLSLSAAGAAALPEADIFANGAGPGGLFLTKGIVTATPVTVGPGVYPLRVPFAAVPRGVSDVTASDKSKYQLNGALLTAATTLKNRGIHAGTADVYTWGLQDPRDTNDTEDIRAVGVQSLPGSLFGAPATDRVINFAINTWGRSANPAVNEYDIAIDNNGDGVPDFFVVGADLGALLLGANNGQLASFTFDASGNLIDAFFADAPLNGSVVELPALASEIGVTAATPAFDYGITGFSTLTGTQDDVAGVAHYDAFSPATSNGDFVALASGASASLTLTVDPSGVTGTKHIDRQPLGWMIVSLDDANGGEQAKLIDLGNLKVEHPPCHGWVAR